MMKRKGYTLLIYNIILALVFCSCSEKRTVTIKGVVKNAVGETLILEHLSGSRPEVVDTIVLDEGGKFKFKPEVEQGPDYFNLRLVTQSIPLVVDTLLTPLYVNADFKNYAVGYEVVNNELNQRLKDANLLGNDLRRDVLNANVWLNDGKITQEEYRDTLLAMIDAYKQNVIENYIYNNPSDPVSYFILFQSVRGLSIFDPYDAEDNRVFGAVATGWMYNYPNSPRRTMLEKVTKEGQIIRKRMFMQAQQADSTEQAQISVSNYFDLELPNHHDQLVALSSLVSPEHVVLIDFTAYYLPVSVTHNQLLAKMHDKYADKGLRIYQVCLDWDENFWKVSANNVPWTVVRDHHVLYDQNGNVQYSRPASTYNVNRLPLIYLLDREGSIKVRVENDEALEKEIIKLL